MTSSFVIRVLSKRMPTPKIAEVADPAKIPTFAAGSSVGVKAKFEMKIDIVKPIPVRKAPAAR